MRESLLEHAFPHLHAKIAKSFLTITHRSASHAFLCSSLTALKVLCINYTLAGTYKISVHLIQSGCRLDEGNKSILFCSILLYREIVSPWNVCTYSISIVWFSVVHALNIRSVKHSENFLNSGSSILCRIKNVIFWNAGYLKRCNVISSLTDVSPMKSLGCSVPLDDASLG